MVIFAFPVLLFSSVLVQYFFMLSEIYIPNKLDQWLMWTVLASMCGNMIGIALVAALGRLKDSTVPVRAPAHRAGAPRIPR